MEKIRRIFLIGFAAFILISASVIAAEGFQIITGLEVEGNQRITTEEILEVLRDRDRQSAG